MALLPPINISLVVFDKRNLAYGSYKQKFLREETQEIQERKRLEVLMNLRVTAEPL